MDEDDLECPLCGQAVAASGAKDQVERLGIHFETCQATRSRKVDPLP